MQKTSRFCTLPKIVCCGVISPKLGSVYYHLGEFSFNAQDMIQVLVEIRARMGDEKVALFWDNARIHHAVIVQEAAA